MGAAALRSIDMLLIILKRDSRRQGSVLISPQLFFDLNDTVLSQDLPAAVTRGVEKGVYREIPRRVSRGLLKTNSFPLKRKLSQIKLQRSLQSGF
jgi:hypothetical protein